MALLPQRGTPALKGSRLAGATLVVLAFSACQGSSGSAAIDDAMGSKYNDVMALAEASDTASQDQRDALLAAAGTGVLDYETYASAIDRTIECMNDAGIKVTRPIADDDWGYPRLTYIAQTGIMGVTSGSSSDGEYEEHVSASPQAPDVDPNTRVADACRERNSMYVEYAYDSQPSSLEAYDQVLVTKRDTVARCGHKVGIDPDPGLPIREFLMEFTQTDEGRLCLQASQINAL